jgi:hypothetical protein
MTSVRVEAIDPPFGSEHGVRFGLQAGREVDDHVPATGTTVFHAEIEIVGGEVGSDFRGRHVRGRKGDRFLYLSWGAPDTLEAFVMLARAKIKLGDIPAELLDEVTRRNGVLVCELQATNDRGQPASGSIRPPAVAWRAENSET